MATTTIKLNKTTKGRLDKLKVTENESYDAVIREMLSILNLLKDTPYDAQERLAAIDIIRKRAVPKVKEDNNS